MAVEVLVAVAAHLLMHRIAVAGDGLGDADLLKLGQQGARIGLQAASVVADAGVRRSASLTPGSPPDRGRTCRGDRF